MINTGQITALYLFDICESADLQAVISLLNVPAERTRLSPKLAIPSSVSYQVPPLQIDGDAFGVTELDGYRVRFKLFDYGVISISLSREFAGSWDDLLTVAHQVTSLRALEASAEQLCGKVVARLRPALSNPRERFLSEDYVVFSLTEVAGTPSAAALVAEHGDTIAQVLRAESEPLSPQERDEVLRHRLSYLADDLVVPTWSTALVYDTQAGVDAALDLFEYANSQLLQFRYYDDLLDDRLARIYKELETTRQYRWWRRNRYTRPAREVHTLYIDVNELTERTAHALKLVGDVYTARLLALVTSRLGVNAWHASVQDKLRTLNDIYKFAVEQTGMERGELLEAAIVAILVFELILFFLGIMN